MNETTIDFFPAAIIGYFNRVTSKQIPDKFTFWKKDSVFTHKKLLYSFYYLKDRYKKLTKHQSYFDSIGYYGKRMIDSGGFQVSTINADIKPEDVIDVYKRERVDIGFILDLPVSKFWDIIKVNKTYENIKYMVSRKSEIPNTELLNVFHGPSIQLKKEYYAKMGEFNDKLDGWAVGLLKRLPPIFNAWSFMYLYENDETLKDKRFHFLGLTGNKNAPVMYYLAKLNLVRHISFDSTKYGREGIMYDMRNPSYLGERLSISKNAFGKLKSNSFCPCPVCRNIDMDTMQHDCNYVIMHNLFWEIQKFKFFDSFETADDLKNHVFNNKEYYKETKVAIQFIDYALKHGLKVAELKYKKELTVKNAVSTKSLEGWF